MNTKPSEIFSIYAEMQQNKDRVYELSNQLNESDISLIEQAHPEVVVLFNAHDKLNGLVENLLQQHQIITWILNKPPKGSVSNEIYLSAHKNLSFDLLKLASKLEQTNPKLAIKVDKIISALQKQAALFVPVLIGLGISALYGALTQHLIFSQGVVQDIESSLIEINEAIDDYPVLQNELRELINQLIDLKILGKEVATVQISALPQQTEASSQALSAVNTITAKKDLQTIELLEKYKIKCVEVLKILPNYIQLLKLKEQQLDESTYDFLNPLKKLYRSIIPSDIKDVILKLETLMGSLNSVPELINSQITLFKEMRNRIESVKKLPTQETSIK